MTVRPGAAPTASGPLTSRGGFDDERQGTLGNSARPGLAQALVANADGSIDLHFGPSAPAGKEGNWLPTLPGRGWFAYFRFYAPTEPHFDRSWSLPDVERVK